MASAFGLGAIFVCGTGNESPITAGRGHGSLETWRPWLLRSRTISVAMDPRIKPSNGVVAELRAGQFSLLYNPR